MKQVGPKPFRVVKCDSVVFYSNYFWEAYHYARKHSAEMSPDEVMEVRDARRTYCKVTVDDVRMPSRF